MTTCSLKQRNGTAEAKTMEIQRTSVKCESLDVFRRRPENFGIPQQQPASFCCTVELSGRNYIYHRTAG